MTTRTHSYQVLINPLESIPCFFPTFLFNEPFYIKKQACEPLYTFYLYHPQKKGADARFHFFIQEATGISPCRGTFGSIEFSPSLPAEHLAFFIQGVDDFAWKRGLQELKITSYPNCYAPEASQLLTANLLQSGFQISQTELNFHVPVSCLPFKELIHPSEKRRLKKCQAAGFTFAKEANPDLIFVHRFIKESRERKGFPMSLPSDAFKAIFEQFPEIYTVFTVRDADRMIALTVTVKINEHILYNFYPADDATYQAFSPTVLLLEGVYEYCRQQGFSLLDLGIATDKGKPNYGLIRFKQYVGGKASLKFSFTKTFSSV